MAWRYKFDGGDEQALDCQSTIYVLAAMAAFAAEGVQKLPTVRTPGTFPYDGHVLELWDDRLVPKYGPYRYGIGLNECGALTIVTLVADSSLTKDSTP